MPIGEDVGFVSIDREIILALIRERERMSVELSHAMGLMTDEQYEEEVEPFLVEHRHVPNLDRRIRRLLELVPDAGSELVSTVFGCSLEDAAAFYRAL